MSTDANAAALPALPRVSPFDDDSQPTKEEILQRELYEAERCLGEMACELETLHKLQADVEAGRYIAVVPGTLAARMRAEYVGEDAIAFDELKPEVRARWERVAAVAKTKPPATREAIARALEDRWCLPGVPTPYEEADVVLAVLAECGEDDDTPIAICPQCYRAHAAAPERASDEELGEVLRRELGMEGLPRPVRAAAAVRARVEAPLLAEIQRLDIENRDRAFYVTEFAAMSQERDTLKARVAELEAGKAGWCERDRGNLLLEMAELREKMGAVKEELTALRPWLREPTGWELDVTPNEAMRAYCETYHEGAQKDWQAVLDLCRSRIRPTFECAECAKTKERKRPSRAELMEIIHGLGFSMIQSNMVVAITDAFLAALEGE